MKLYGIYIKSHCEAPDYEDEVEAISKEEAVEYFLSKLNQPVYYSQFDKLYNSDWGAADIKKHVAVLED